MSPNLDTSEAVATSTQPASRESATANNQTGYRKDVVATPSLEGNARKYLYRSPTNALKVPEKARKNVREGSHRRETRHMSKKERGSGSR